MKIYFAASIRGGRDMAHVYPGIVQVLKDNGHEVLSEMFADQNIDEKEGTDKDDDFIFKRDVAWVEEADAVVAEVTQASLGVGYELGIAERMEKKVICLFNDCSDRKLSAMIEGNPNFSVLHYKTLKEIELQLPSLLQ